MNRIILAVIFLLIIFGGGVLLLSKEAKAPPDGISTPTPFPTKETETPQNEPIEAKSGNFFTINLNSNPTTGYSWEESYDSDYLRLIDSHFVSTASEELLGAGGLESFNFVALKTGETEITFSYQRSWEKEPIETRVYRVKIK